MDHTRAAVPVAEATRARRHAAGTPAAVRALRGAARRDALATLLVAGLLTYTALTPLSPFARDTYGNDLRRHLILGGAIAGYALLLLLRRWLPPRTPFDLPILAVLGAVAAGVARSLDPRVSGEAALTVLPTVPLFYLLADGRLIGLGALRRGMMLTGVLLAAFALASVWRQWQGWLALVRAVDGGVGWATLAPPSVPRVEGVGSHPNVLSAVLAMLAPVYLLSLAGGDARRAHADGHTGERPSAGNGAAVREAQRPRRRAWLSRTAAGGGLALVAAALFFTLSRAAWAGAAAGLIVAAAGMAFAARWRLRRRGVWVIGVAGACVAVAVLALAMGSARPDWLFRDSLNPRADMRRVGVAIFRDHPLTGAGPGLYVALYPQYGGSYPFAAVHSHNVIVQVAADYGVVGLAAGGILLLTVGVCVGRLFLRGTPAQRRISAAVAGTVTAFLVHGLADAPHLFPEVWLVLGAAAALVLRAGEAAGPAVSLREDGGGRHMRGVGAAVVGRSRPGHAPGGALRAARALPAVIVLVGGVALLGVWRYTDRAAADHQRSVRAAEQERWDEAVTWAARAAARDPRLAGYHLQLGAALAARYHQAGDAADRDAAMRAFERGLALQPRNGAAWADLASLRLDAGDAPGARSAIVRLRGLAGRDTLLRLAYAVLVQRSGTAAEAVETYAGLLALDPTLALTPFWRDDPFRRAHYDAIVDRALERAQEIGGPGAAQGLRTAIRLLTGRDVPREAELRASLAAAPGDGSLQLALGRLLTAGGRLADAEPLLRAAVVRKGDSADAHAALGNWYAAAGDRRRARDEWLRAFYLGDAAAGDALGRSFAAGAVPDAVIEGQRRLVEGAAIGRFYLLFQSFRFTFQRHEPVPIIGAGDWLDALPDDLAGWQADLSRWQEERGR